MRPYFVVIGLLLTAFAGTILFHHFYTGDRIHDFAQQAIREHSPDPCNQLETRHEEPPGPVERDGKGAPYVTYPRNLCLHIYLRATKDRQVCGLLNPQTDDADDRSKEACYNFIADVYQDPSVCANLDGTPHSWKSIPICRAVAKRDVRECDVLTEVDKHLSYSSKTDCILEVVKRTKDASSCEGITGPGYGSFDPEATSAYKSTCLKLSWCDKPEKQAAYCAQIQYPSWVLPEEKARCATEEWKC